MKKNTHLTIKAKNIKSSVLYSLHYKADASDPMVGRLLITFRAKDGAKGKTYRYEGVALNDVAGVTTAHSAGKAFIALIKKNYEGKVVVAN